MQLSSALLFRRQGRWKKSLEIWNENEKEGKWQKLTWGREHKIIINVKYKERQQYGHIIVIF